MKVAGVNEVNRMQVYSREYSASYDKSADHDNHDATVHDKS